MQRLKFLTYIAAVAVLAICAYSFLGRAYATDGAGNRAPDFARIRAEYGDREDFAVVCQRGHPLRQLVQLTIEQRFQEVLALAEPWVAKCPVDIDGRFFTAVALSRLGREQEAQEHILWFRGLVDSVLASGDGKSPETAFVVISVSEEYAVLRALDLRVKSQAVTTGRVDALKVDGKHGESTVYFNPAAHFRRLERALGTRK